MSTRSYQPSRILNLPHFSHIRSTEDISSSGYSSGDAIGGPITRQGAMGRGQPVTRPRIKAKRNEVEYLINREFIRFSLGNGRKERDFCE